MIRRPPRSTQSRSSAASDVYKRQLPIQKVHPDDENGKSTCDPDMLKKIREHMVIDENITDPRWDELKNLVKN